MLSPYPECAGGFALIEVLVAALVRGLGLLGAAGMLSRSIGFTQDTERRQMAAMLAGELMETLPSAAASRLPPRPRACHQLPALRAAFLRGWMREARRSQ